MSRLQQQLRTQTKLQRRRKCHHEWNVNRNKTNDLVKKCKQHQRGQCLLKVLSEGRQRFFFLFLSVTNLFRCDICIFNIKLTFGSIQRQKLPQYDVIHSLSRCQCVCMCAQGFSTLIKGYMCCDTIK